LLCTGCTIIGAKQEIKPFDGIPINSTKRIEFSNLTITSSEKESGRSKMITNTQDIQDIGEYLKTISCIESNQRDIGPDFTISLIDNTEKEKSYIYSIGISKNLIYIYKYSSKQTNKFVYKHTGSKVIGELRELYNKMNYKEEILVKK
jgi:hypothetical protein